MYEDWDTAGAPWQMARHCSQNSTYVKVAPNWIQPGPKAPELSLVAFGSGYPCVPGKITLATDRPPEGVTVTRYAAGTPLRAFGGAEISLLTPTKDPFRVWSYTRSSLVMLPRVMSVDVVELPTRILPLGFAIDTAIFSAIAFAALSLPRIKRIAWYPGPGHCANCGYDLRGLPNPSRCPECGRNRQ